MGFLMKIYHLKYKNKSVPCYITYKKVKNINMRISADQGVKISVPKGLDFQVITDFIESKKDWIIKKVTKFEMMKNINPKILKEGIKLYYLGEEYTLLIEEGDDYVKINNNNLVIFSSDCSHKNIKKVFYQWQKKKSRLVFMKILEDVYPFVQIYGVKYPKLKVKKMVTRWGSCSCSKGNINMNQFLVALPVEVIRYVMFHELAHFIEPNHSRNFYKIIEKFMPNYTVYRKYLKNIRLR